jgi:hypothetical protein
MAIDYASLLSGAAKGLGSYLTGNAQAATSKQGVAQQNIQGQTDAYANATQFNANDALARQKYGATLTDPTKIQNWRQQQAVLGALMPQFRNVSIAAPSGMESYKPTISGGARLPEGGFSAADLAAFTPNARLEAENTYWENAAPFLQSTPNLSAVGYGGTGDPYTTANAANLTSHLQDVQKMFATNQQNDAQSRLKNVMSLATQSPFQSDKGSVLGGLLSALLGLLGGAVNPNPGGNTAGSTSPYASTTSYGAENQGDYLGSVNPGGAGMNDYGAGSGGLLDDPTGGTGGAGSDYSSFLDFMNWYNSQKT